MSATSLFRLPRRNPKPRPAHARGMLPAPVAKPEPQPESAAPLAARPGTDMTLVAAPPADPDATMRFPAIEDEETPAARPLPVPHLDVPAEFPPTWSTGPEVLRRAAESLRALPVRPGAHLRNITPGDDPNPYDQLSGFPVFAGTTLAVDGHPAAGLYLGNEDADGRLVLDVFDPAWLDELIDAAVRARRALDAMTDAPAAAVALSDDPEVAA